ncbi:type II secretion system protein GspL [Oceanobacter sp. 3_MG-2023]|uniref:type II secretion system protein GspL n=1 Tax=Oceanobacter sp. 3_MG-2023 TaxID=3062622 RepID=UPI002735ED3F|nr:type II secretion system protein GspL [Oceanobacter sp. 3_MG-2023]MDP2504277.1 type II secretion system protein GspL [Oceanobacter sp. 3_MG-2023]
MNTIKVTWQGHDAQWLVSDPSNDAVPACNLEDWAADQPDLTPVRMILSAANYSCHWIELPGVSGRHLAQALPFALEENLINDISEYLIVPAGKVGVRARAYVTACDLVERLLEQAEHLHLTVRELIPETQLLPEAAIAVWQDQGWLVKLPGVFEGWVNEFAIMPVLESVLEDQQGLGVLTIHASGLDQANLLRTTIETGFADAFERIDISSATSDSPALPTSHARPVNMLIGQFQVRHGQADKPRSWWRPLASLATACLLIMAVTLYVQNRQLANQSQYVYQQSLALYKQLFPGVRIRALEREFRGRLAEGGHGNNHGFTYLINTTASAFQSVNLKTIKLDSARYNERQQELIIEVQASNLSELQTLRQALSERGLDAEVASASNEDKKVKGRLKIGESA